MLPSDLGPNWTTVILALVGVVGSIVALIGNSQASCEAARAHSRLDDLSKAALDHITVDHADPNLYVNQKKED